jgi:hypothetical protein
MNLIMKYIMKIQKLILGLFLIVGLLSSCTKDFEEMNQNPNNPVDVPAINIFTNAVYNSINRQLGGWMQHTYLGPWSQQWCKIQYIDEDKYMPRDMSGEFNAPFTSELKNLQIVIDKATASGDDKLVGASKVLRAWVFLYITDTWGAVPYSEAIQGLYVDGIMTPKYDTQESIYLDLLAQLEEANVLLSGSSLSFGGGDLLYGGDPTLWRKFANSLKLRILNRAAGTPWSFTYNMAGGGTETTVAGAAAMSDADTRMAAILADPTQYPIFESNADNAELVWPGIPYRNPIYNTLFARKDQAISETMVDWLKARTDPRLHIFAAPTLNSVALGTLDYVGFQNGRAITGATFPEISMLGTEIAFIEGATSKVMTYDEVQFLKAEHYLRTSQDGLAQDAYEAGIEASMTRWGLADGGTVNPSWGFAGAITVGATAYPVNYTTYLSEPLVAWSGTTAEKFQKIIEQKWASLFGQGIEAYTEVRRTGFPARIFEYELEGSFYPNLGLPIRIQYALSEQTYNTDNLTAAISDEGIELINEGMFSTNGIQSQVWWHTRKNPIPTTTDVK